jgi:hypothetical protein
MKTKNAVALMTIIAFSSMFLQRVNAVSATNNSNASWTFMVYMDCDNNLDYFGPFNLQQMSDGLVAGAEVNVIVLMDRLDLPAYTYEVTHDHIKTVQSLDEVDMGSPDTLSSFVAFVTASYPATYFFLDVWDHGGGYRGACWDDSSGNHLSPHDIETALAAAESETGIHVQVVGFDACLMGMVEVCYELKEVTDVVVGSEMLTPGYGWPYTQLMTYLSTNAEVDPFGLCTELINEYVSYYPKYMVQLTAVDETLVSEFASSLDNFAETLQADIYAHKSIIAGARSASQQNHILGTANVYYYIDLYRFTSLIRQRTQAANVAEKAADLVNKLNDLVFAEAHTARIANLDAKQFGLTINFPPNAKAYSQNYETYVPCFVSETSWLSLMMTFYEAK